MNNRLYTIQETADILGVSTKTLRRWDQRGRFVPTRTAGNQRRYTQEQIQEIKNQKSKIKNLHLEAVPESFFQPQAPKEFKPVQGLPSVLSSLPSNSFLKHHFLLRSKDGYRTEPGKDASKSKTSFARGRLAKPDTRRYPAKLNSESTVKRVSAFKIGFMFASLVLVLSFAGSVVMTRYNLVAGLAQKKEQFAKFIANLPQISISLKPRDLSFAPQDNQAVLAATAGDSDLILNVNVPAFFSQSVGIGTTTVDPSAALDIASEDKGFLAPRMTTVQRDAIATPATSLFVYNTDTNHYNMYNGTAWQGVFTSIGDSTLGEAFTKDGKEGNSLYFHGTGGGNTQVTAGASSSTSNVLTFPDTTGTFITTGNLTAITKVGTVSTGVWNGTVLTVPYGGTGVSTLTGIVLGNGTGVMTGLTTSLGISGAITDETGTGAIVFGTSPAITTSLTTASTTFALINTAATTVNFAGAATTLSVGAATGTVTLNNATTAITGALTANGDVTLGDAITDNITFTGRVAQDADLIPITTTGTNDLGSSALPWDNLYANNVIAGGTSGIFGWLQRNSGALSPTNISDDLLLGATSTSSAKFGFLNVAGGNPTATISGNLSLIVPTTAGANTLNLLNNSTLNFQRSPGGDAGLATALFIQNTGNVGIGNTTPLTALDVTGSASLSANLSLRGAGTAHTFNILDNGTLNFQRYPSGDAANNSSVLFLGNNGNVGIGVTAPNESLESSGNIVARGGVVYINTARTEGLRDRAAGIDIILDSGDFFPATDNAVNLGGTANRWLNAYFSGNVGIGNTTPLTALDVTGSASLSASLSLRGAGTAHTFNILDNGTLNIRRSPGGDAGVTTALLFLQNNGNVGIGNTAPTTTLDITGTLKASSTVTFTGLTASRALFTDASSNLAASGASLDLLNALTDETGTGVAVFGTSPEITTSLTTASTAFALVNTTATTVNFAGAATTLTMGATTGTASIRNTTVNFPNATAIGIGNTAPLAALDVTGSASVSANLSLRGSGTAHLVKILDNGSLNFITSVGGDAVTNSTLFIGNGTAAGSGNVGIGTTAPSALLSVGSTSQFQVNSSGNVTFAATLTPTANFTLGSASYTGTLTTSDWAISSAGALTGISGITNDGSYTQTGTSANTFTGTSTFSNATYSALFTGGNVGIGTTSPLAALDVRGNLGTVPAASISAVSSFAAFLVDNSGVGDLFTASKSGAMKFVITNAGNVGIGNNLPGTLLSLANNGWFSAASTQSGQTTNMFKVNTADQIQVGAALNIDGGITFPTDGGNLVMADLPLGSSSQGTKNSYTFKIGSDNILTVYGENSATAGTLQNGRVGIGTTAPLTALDVTGSASLSANLSLRGAGTAHTFNILDNGTLNIRRSPGGDAGVTTALLFLQNNGNVGIGNTAPTATLDITGTLKASSTVAFTGLTASRALFTDASSNLAASGASLDLLNALTDETGTGVSVFGTSPEITTSLTTASTTFALVNSAATTVNFAGAATTLTMGATTGTASIRNTTVNFPNATAIGIGNTTPLTALDVTGSASLSANLSLRGAGTAHTFNILDNGTLNIRRSPGGDAGVTTALLFLQNNGNVGIGNTAPAATLDITGTLKASSTVAFTGLTASRALFTDASSNLAASGASLDLLNALTDETGTGVTVFGTSPEITTSLTTASTTFALVNTAATTLNFAGAATALTMGGTTGTASIRNTTVNFPNATAVGIGNTAPLAALDVTGSASLSANLSLRGSGTAHLVKILDNGSLNFATSVGGDAVTNSTLFIGNGTAAGSGNVGIGTTGPAAKLHILDAANNVDIRLGESTSLLTNIRWNVGNNQAEWDTDSYGYPILLDGSKVVLQSKSSGNVGIGTTGPLAALDVRGNLGTVPAASVSAQTSFASMIVDNSGVGDLFTASKSGAIKFTINNNGNLQFAGQTNFLTTLASAATAAKTITFPDATGTVALGTGTANYASYWSGTNTLAAEQYLAVSRGGTGVGTFTTNGVLYGNGTTSVLVTAQGGANTILTANSGAPAFSASPTIGTSVTTPLVIGGTAVGSSLSLQSTSGVGTTDFINFKVGNNGATEAMRILNSGFVGIANTAPLTALDVTGSASLSANLSLRGAGTAHTFNILDNGTLNFQRYPAGDAANNSSVLFLGNNGNVGIGTTGPGYKLEVAGNAKINSGGTDTYLYYPGGSGNTFHIDSDGFHADLALRVVGLGKMTFTTNDGELMRLIQDGAGGKVGIGNTAPLTALDVTGSASLSANLSLRGAGTAHTFNILDNGTLNIRRSPGGDAGVTTALLFLQNNGNVGIGNTAPTTTLDITGTLKASSTVTFTGLTASRALFTDASSNLAASGASLDLLNALTDETGTGVAVFGTAPTFTTSITNPLVIGGTGTTSTLTLRSTSGVGAAGADILFQTGNNGATEAMRILNGGNVGIGNTAPSFKLEVNDAGGTLSTDFQLVAGGTNPAIGAADTNKAAYLYADSTNNIFGLNAYNYTTSAGLRIDIGFSGQNIALAKSGGNVGIGNTAPLTALDVTGSASLSANLSLRGAGTAHTFNILDNGTLNFQRYPSGDAGNNSSVLFLNNNGNIGIGNTAPLTKLDIAGSASASGSLSLGSASGTTRTIGATAMNPLQLGDALTGDLIFAPANTTAMTIKNGGNVGIGTTNPLSKFQVEGSGVNIRLVNQNSTVWNIGQSEIVNEFSIGDASAIRLHINNVGNVGIGNTAPLTALDVTGSASLSANLSLRGAGTAHTFNILDNGTLNFQRYPSGDAGNNSSVLFLQNNGNVGIGTTSPVGLLQAGASPTPPLIVLSSGFVGIGTTVPTTALHIESATGVIYMKSTTATNGVRIRMDNTSVGNYFGVENSAGGGMITGTSAYATVMGNSGDYPIQLATNNVVRMAITGTGNVGIGTTSPSSLLDVQGTGGVFGTNLKDILRLVNTDTAAANNGVNIELSALRTGGQTTPAASISALMTNIGSTTYTGALAFSTAGTAAIPTERMRIDGAGNVGIGTTGPGAPLHVARTTAGSFIQMERVGTRTWELNLASGYFNIADITGNVTPFVLETSAPDNSFYMKSTGNVGIGNTTPLTALDVTGSASLSANLSLRGAGTAHTFNILDNGTLNFQRYPSGDAANNSSVLFLGNNGNVGIGTTAPENKLDVRGGGMMVQGAAAIPGVNTKGLLIGYNTTGNGYGTIDAAYWGSTNTSLVIGSLTVTPVGLGETSPASLLSVKGGISVGETTDYSQTLAPTGGMIIKGNVGIGTTSPLTALDVTGSASLSANLSLRGSGTAHLVKILDNGTLNFATSVGGDAVTNSTLFIGNGTAAGAGNVGIGTTSPTTKLDVNGTITGTRLNIVDAATYIYRTSANDLIFGSNSVDTVTLSNGIFRPSVDNNVALGIVGTRWNQLFVGTGNSSFAGNVGIGNTAPLTALDITGSASLSANLSLRGAGTAHTFNILDNGTLNFQRYPSGDAANNSSVLFLGNNGNVGIGNTAPSALLSVGSTSQFQVNSSGNVTFAATLTPTANFTLGSASYTGALTTSDWAINSTGALTGITGITNDGSYTQTGTSANTFTGTPTFSNATYSALFTGGNVGIGTTAPAANLEIRKDATGGLDTFLILRVDGNAVAGRGVAMDFNVAKSVGTTTLGARIAALNGVATDTGDLTFYTNNGTVLAEKMRILGSGNVGIGTTSPLAALDVRGNLGTVPAASISAVSSFAAFLVDNSGVGDLFTASKSGAMKFVITNAGNVGIGNNLPGTLLSLANNGWFSAASTQSGQTTNMFKVNTADQIQVGAALNIDGGITFPTDGGNLVMADLPLGSSSQGTKNSYTFKIGSDNILTVYGENSATAGTLQNGRVGIGITAPLFKLDVRDSQTSTAAAQIYNTGATGTGLAIKLGFTGVGAATNVFASFLNDNGLVQGLIKSNASGGITYQTNGVADFAEYFKKDQSSNIPFGSVVCFDNNGLAVACDNNSNKIVGVASEHPAFLGGANLGDRSVAVGLVGQVRTRVSTANGAIKIGDPLTTSSTAGVAVKATQTGQILGKAIEGFDGSGEGKILVSVNIGWYNPSIYVSYDGTLAGMATTVTSIGDQLTLQGQTLASQGEALQSWQASASAQVNYVLATDPLFAGLNNKIADLESRLSLLSQKAEQQASTSAFLMEIVNSQVLGASTSAVLDLGDVELNNAVISDSLNVLGRTTVTDLGVTGNINAGLLSIHGMDSIPCHSGLSGTCRATTINTVGDLYLQNNLLGGVDILNGKVVIDTTGNMKVAGTVTADAVEANTYTVLGDQSIGSAAIPAGLTSIDILTSVASGSSKIFLTSTSLTDKQITVISKSIGKFKVAIPTTSTSPITFDWWIVGNR